MANMFNYDQFTEADKIFCRSLKATFVMAPREMSKTRILQLVKANLVKGNVVFGVAKEKYVDGFEGQAQFKTMSPEDIFAFAAQVSQANIAHKLYLISYKQRQVDDVIRAIRPKSVVVVRGSYMYPFHRSSTYALLEKRKIPFEYASPFTDELWAKNYLHRIQNEIAQPELAGEYDDIGMMSLVADVSRMSFDYTFQTGAVLALNNGSDPFGGYKPIVSACNEVVPYQTYALHFGNAREVHLAAHQGDAVHYDTIHAEMNVLVKAMQQNINFEGLSLFINMMPCPNCARTLVKTGLKEVVYQQIHSDGYAVDLFDKAGIKTRRVL